MDGITIATGAIALAKFATSLIQTVETAIKAVPTMRKELESTRQGLQALSPLLSSIATTFDKVKSSPNNLPAQYHVRDAVKGCRATLEELSQVMQSLHVSTTQNKATLAYKGLRWSRIKNDIGYLIAKLESDKMTVLLSLQLSNLELLSSIQSVEAEHLQSMNNRHKTDHANLGAAMWSSYNAAYTSRAPAASVWLLNHATRSSSVHASASDSRESNNIAGLQVQTYGGLDQWIQSWRSVT